ncbi:hypothetical protein [Variovorax sp. JS1663]|uniref:hypothetical protein n=1 Tax=Variovorax sp. JS1663 TaxID=1851577 RepID=UPI000B346B34|nr:hypothetical protein [Variovorax sp. JS1663]OUM00532.1 hypothetical protein A8M77_20920 [Variovorax sp. JS1663]
MKALPIRQPAKERPILFSAPMVRALQAGTKTQTRRVMARQKQHAFTDYTLFGQRGHPDDEAACRGGWAQPWVAVEHAPDWPDGKEDRCHCPYARARGDRLWVRETHRAEELPDGLDGIRYLADDAFRPIEGKNDVDAWLKLRDYGGRKGANVPGIHMTRWASRILLEVTRVRVERLQDISEADALAEGVAGHPDGPWHAYRSLWTLINGAGSWAANPWVWVVEFRRIRP